MRKTAIAVVITMVLAVAAGINAADTKVNGRLYTHWMMDMSDGAESYNEFGK